MTENVSLFDSFNARFLEPTEVAKSFVPSVQFDRLLKKNHSLVVGPRGSGKTTMLMMLQGQAWDAWNRQERPESNRNLAFTGVFIPTDVSWGKQLESLGGRQIEPEHQEIFTKAAFTTHILRRMVIAMEYESTRFNTQLDPSIESLVAKELSGHWELSPRCVSLRGLKYGLTARLNWIRTIARQESLLNSGDRAERLAMNRVLHFSYLDCISLAIDVFDDARETPTAKWGLLFDELELAPKFIRNSLLESLRSVNERVLFKLSIAPVIDDDTKLHDVFGASPSNDFEIIQLWYSSKEHSYAFCRSLWKQQIAQSSVVSQKPEDVLGSSAFDTESEEWVEEGTAYGPNSRLSKRFKSLRDKDQSFADYLRVNKIDLDNLDKLAPNRRAATVRKATSIVAIRDAILSKGPIDGKPGKRRSREVIDVYSGATAMFAMVEGNPRWFKAIIGDLINSMKIGEQTIGAPNQARAIEKAALRFRALLRTIPCPPFNAKGMPKGLVSLIDTIGNYFNSELIDAPFGLDPPNSFTIHLAVRKCYWQALDKQSMQGQ